MRLLKSESGVALLEFAILAPVMLLLLVGTIDVGRYMYDGIVASSAARAGTQTGAVSLSTAADAVGMQSAAYADAQNLPNMTAVATYFCTGSTGAPATCGTAGATTYVQVQTSGTFTPLIKYPLLPSSITVNGLSVMRVVQQ